MSPLPPLCSLFEVAHNPLATPMEHVSTRFTAEHFLNVEQGLCLNLVICLTNLHIKMFFAATNAHRLTFPIQNLLLYWLPKFFPSPRDPGKLPAILDMYQNFHNLLTADTDT